MDDIFKLIKEVSVNDLDLYITNNEALMALMLQNTELIRLKTIDYFQQKKEYKEAERELEQLGAEKTRNLSPEESKNAESRKAAVTLDPAYKAQKKHKQELELALEEIEQHLWTLRHLESTLKHIAELRKIEIQKIV